MTTTAPSRPSPRTPWAPHSQARSHHKSSTTPVGYPTRTPGSAGLAPISAKGKIPSAQPEVPRSPSPNYFGLIVEPGQNPVDSNAGSHVKNNWVASPPGPQESLRSPRGSQRPPPPDLEAFRRQSETHTFTLGDNGNLARMGSRHNSGKTPTLKSLETDQKDKVSSQKTRSSENRDLKSPKLPRTGSSTAPLIDSGNPRPHQRVTSPFNIVRTESPTNLSTSSLLAENPSHSVDRHAHKSLPHTTAALSTPSSNTDPSRSATTPAPAGPNKPQLITAQSLFELCQSYQTEDILLLDLRASPQYQKSRIDKAMNLCIPTTLLKRPLFNVQKLMETFAVEAEKEKFAQWMTTRYIIVYDASSSLLKDATSGVNTLKKFTNEGWQGTPIILRGGFAEFSKKYPHLIVDKSHEAKKTSLSIDSSFMPVAGGCPMPSAKDAPVNPFFGNIRQNMDLIGGVGQMPLKLPNGMTDRYFQELPAWIREAADSRDQGKAVADRFLSIEKAEQARMQKALSARVSYGNSTPTTGQHIQVAGIEKGVKNRYKDMLPFDHTRVRLQGVSLGDCDYVNASHIKLEWSERHYIASQAPTPATFADFWRVVWEQDARIIVMLTAESEGGQLKSHPYWLPGDYGTFKLKSISERQISLDPSATISPIRTSPVTEQRTPGRRRATTHVEQDPFSAATSSTQSPPTEIPFAIVRKLTLFHTAEPFSALREITQVHYSNWPDFGTPAHPTHLLALVEHCNALVRETSSPTARPNPHLPAPVGERPIVVHCSAGCGRTGTFCTVDSVIDILKRQRAVRRDDGMDVDSEDGKEGEGGGRWELRDDEDLVGKIVGELRGQRISMVQTLRQFVLCYESILEWMGREMGGQGGRERGARRSFAGF